MKFIKKKSIYKYNLRVYKQKLLTTKKKYYLKEILKFPTNLSMLFFNFFYHKLNFFKLEYFLSIQKKLVR